MDINLLSKLYKRDDTSSMHVFTFDSSMDINGIEETEYTLANGGTPVVLTATKGLIVFSTAIFRLTGDIAVDPNQFFGLFAPLTVSLSNPGTIDIDCTVFILS